jgi:hypothetical protein
VKKIFITFMLSTFVLSGVSVSAIYGEQEDQASLEIIELDRTAESLKVIIVVSGEFGYQHFELEDPARLVVEISTVGEIRTEEFYDVDAFGVKAVRTGRYKPDTARIVFDLMEIPPSYEILQVASGIEVVFRRTQEVERVPQVTEKPIEEKPVPEVDVKQESHLKSVSYGRRDDQLKVDIHIDGEFYYRSVELRQFSQLIIDFWPVPLLSAESLKNINLSGLREINVQKTGPDTARILLEFSGMLSSFKIDRRENGLSITFLSVEEKVGVPAGVAPKKKVIYKPIESSAVTLTFGPYDVFDQVYNQIYIGNTLMFGFELSQIFARNDNHNFGVVLGANYYKDTGSSTLTREEATFTLIPYYMCVEYLWNQEEVIPFIRLGLNIMSYKEKSEVHEVSGSSFGPQVALGIYIKIPEIEQLRLKFYFMWMGATAEEEDVSINIGGIEAGLGITLGFNLF